MKLLLALASLSIVLNTKYGVANASCSLCPEGSELIHADRFLFEDTTCGDFADGFAASGLEAGSQECAEAIAVWTASINYVGYCCSGINTTDICSLCGDGELIDGAIEVPETEFTCSDLEALASYTLDPNICPQYSLAAPVCCEGLPEPCKLCETMTKPDAIIPFAEEGDETTCGDIRNFFALFPEGETCDELYANFTEFINFRTWCGCEDAVDELGAGCNFCDGLPLSNPDFVIPDYNGATCAELDFYGPHVVDAGYCSLFTPVIPYCCQNTDPDPVCSLCPEGKVTEPDKLAAVLDIFTCSDMENAISFFDEEECAADKENPLYWLDLPSYCGCPTVEPPNKFSDECPEGKEVLRDAYIPGQLFTCGFGFDLIPYITNQTIYDENVVPAKQFCCVDIEVSEAPTPGVTETPTPGVTEAAESSGVFLAFDGTNLVLSLGLVFLSTLVS